MENTNNEAIKKAKKVLEEISQDERERYLADLRQKHILDQKAIEDAGFDKGLAKGIAEGLEKGLAEGLEKLKEEKIEIAKRMLNSNVDIESIIYFTGLSKEEIENLI